MLTVTTLSLLFMGICYIFKKVVVRMNWKHRSKTYAKRSLVFFFPTFLWISFQETQLYYFSGLTSFSCAIAGSSRHPGWIYLLLSVFAFCSLLADFLRFILAGKIRKIQTHKYILHGCIAGVHLCVFVLLIYGLATYKINSFNFIGQQVGSSCYTVSPFLVHFG